MTSDVGPSADRSSGTEPFLRITRISVEDLFGLYRHEVALNTRDRITIIHGPNGVGKTVLLKLVSAVFKADYLELVRTPFSSFQVGLNDGSFIEVLRPSDTTDSNPLETPLSITLNDTATPHLAYTFQMPPQKAAQFAPFVDRQVPWIQRLSPETWLDQRTGEQFTAAEVLLEYIDKLPHNMRQQVLEEPEWLSALREKVSVYLIETQRLLREASGDNWPGPRTVRGMPHTATVRNYANAVLQTIQQTQALYANISQQLDRSFPQRLISGAIVPLTNEALKDRINTLEAKRTDLSDIGLMDTTEQFNIGEFAQFPEGQRPAMTLFLSDSEAKLATLESLARRIKDFLAIVNGRFKNKKILINRTQGMQARTSKGRFFDLAALSSGEQHELVLAYDLLFNVQPNTFVMIDEPEISLHLTWQKSFLADLQRIVETAKIDVLLATHSPYIAGDRDDLMVPLTADVE